MLTAKERAKGVGRALYASKQSPILGWYLGWQRKKRGCNEQPRNSVLFPHSMVQGMAAACLEFLSA